ncbi:hypothetical protein BDL97_08G108300 [Sphagnum fallax]|nr:hypothetical protein BDL97_08G108300 [Sphagnum fallax]
MAWIAQQPRLISRWELAMQAGDQPCSRAPLCSYRSKTQMLLPSLGQRELSISSAAQHHVALRKLIWNGHLGRLALDLLSHSQGKKSSHHQCHCSVQEEPHILHSSSMEETYNALAQRLLAGALMCEPGCKYIVGIAGPPGAGKSTVAQEVVARLNMLWHETHSEKASSAELGTYAEIAIAVPMDGFHLYRWQLDAMEDPTEAHARRGAPWTFNPAMLVKHLENLRIQGWEYMPSFDHGVGDPVEKDIYVAPQHKVVVVEGNYLLLSDGDWKDLESIFDERWFIEIDIEEAMNRVEKRHIATGKTSEVAKWRVGYNDRPNAELIAISKWNADLVIPSLTVY